MTVGAYALRMGTAFSAIYFGPEDGSVFIFEESDEMKRVGSLFETNLTRPGGFSVLTATHSGYVNVLVKSHSARPAVMEDASAWEDMAMSSFSSPTGELTAQASPEMLGDESPNLIDGPGTYAVRVLARGRDGAQPEDVSEPGPDSYPIEIWPTSAAASDESFSTSEKGKEWVEVYQTATDGAAGSA